MVFKENFLRLTVIVHFQNILLQKRDFFYPFLQSISYNNKVATKQI